MENKECDAETLLNTRGQRWRQILHALKAKWIRKERVRVEELSAWIPQGATVLDVGAHFGYFAKEFARLYRGQCQVLCFEPVDYTRSILQIVVGRMPNVKIFDEALADSDGEQEISIPIKASGWIGPGLAHMGREESRNFITQKIRLRRLDDVATEQGLKRLDFVKCDVEGAELLVFRGGIESLKHFHPTVLCEVHQTYTARMGYTPDELFDFFFALGYQALRRTKAGEWQSVTSFSGPDDYLFTFKASRGVS